MKGKHFVQKTYSLTNSTHPTAICATVHPSGCHPPKLTVIWSTVSPSIWLSVHLAIQPGIRPRPFVQPSVRLSDHLSIYRTVSPAIQRSVCHPSVSVSTRLSPIALIVSSFVQPSACLSNRPSDH